MSLDVSYIYIFISMGLQGDKKTDQLPIFPKGECKWGFLIKAETRTSQCECCLYESILE